MQYQQLLIFELSRGCNLAQQHAGRCPISDPTRWANQDTSRPLTDDLVVECCRIAYREMGFGGFIGWHLYNEPCIDWPRLHALMVRIKGEIPEARFYLFTNGELLPHDRRQLGIVNCLWISNYCGQDWSDVTAWHPRIIVYDEPGLDNRMSRAPDDRWQRCCRPFTELIVDHFGNFQICCFDWRGTARLPNVWDVGFRAAAEAFLKLRDKLALEPMAADAPPACRCCAFRADPCPLDYTLQRKALIHLHGEHLWQGDNQHPVLESQWLGYEFRGSPPGRLLEIGAYDGWTESVTYQLRHHGWRAVMVEPDPFAFCRLIDRFGNSEHCRPVHAAVTADGRLSPFWIERTDGQVSTCSEALRDHFAAIDGKRFLGTVIPTMAVRDLLAIYGGPRGWDLVVVDVEGINQEVLSAMPWADMTDTRIVVAEQEGSVASVMDHLSPWYQVAGVTEWNVLARRRPGI